MQLHEDHDKFHLDRARELFPADADLLFLSACQRETYAGSPIQNAVRSAIAALGSDELSPSAGEHTDLGAATLPETREGLAVSSTVQARQVARATNSSMVSSPLG